MYRVNRVLIVFLAAVGLIACRPDLNSETDENHTYQYQIPAELGDGWKTASLEAVGCDSQAIIAMMEDIQGGGYDNLHSVLIVKDGKLVFEEYFRGYNPSRIGDVASVTKSVTSIMVGIAMDQGLIESPDQSLSELLPAYKELIQGDERKAKLKLHHLLSMTSGIEWDEETYPYGHYRNDATRMARAEDPIRFILSRPVIREPGAQFQYSGANSMLLSAILQEATGLGVVSYARQYLFEPLGISQYGWESYEDGHTNTDGGLSLRPRDMAKIGQLMLNQGQWDGVQILSPEWVTISTQAHTKIAPGVQYGYQWWREKQSILLERVESFFAAGYGGQLISVYPDQDMVVIFTGQTRNHQDNTSRLITLRSKYLLPATIPATFSKAMFWTWGALTIGGLAFLILDIAKGRLTGFGWCSYWVVVGALWGPLGVGTYGSSFRNPATRKAAGWRAMGLAVFSVTGNILAIILLALYQLTFQREGSILMAMIPVAFLVSWVGFLTPLAAFRIRSRYWKTLGQTILTGFISTCYVLIGILPVLIALSYRWPVLNGVLFWVMMLACGMAGAAAVYPFSYWLIQRGFDIWPGGAVKGRDMEASSPEKRMPTLRDAWAPLLLALVLFISLFGFLVSMLS